MEQARVRTTIQKNSTGKWKPPTYADKQKRQIIDGKPMWYSCWSKHWIPEEDLLPPVNSSSKASTISPHSDGSLMSISFQPSSDSAWTISTLSCAEHSPIHTFGHAFAYDNKASMLQQWNDATWLLCCCLEFGIPSNTATKTPTPQILKGYQAVFLCVSTSGSKDLSIVFDIPSILTLGLVRSEIILMTLCCLFLGLVLSEIPLVHSSLQKCCPLCLPKFAFFSKLGTIASPYEAFIVIFRPYLSVVALVSLVCTRVREEKLQVGIFLSNHTISCCSSLTMPRMESNVHGCVSVSVLGPDNGLCNYWGLHFCCRNCPLTPICLGSLRMCHEINASNFNTLCSLRVIGAILTTMQ